MGSDNHTRSDKNRCISTYIISEMSAQLQDFTCRVDGNNAVAVAVQEQWLRLAPDAKFVFVYRHPTQVIHSLRRRGDAELQWQYPGAASVASFGGLRFRIAKAASMWIQYNRRIVEFTRKHPKPRL